MADDFLEQYNAVKNGVGWRDLTQERSKLAAVGPDRISFLHALLSNDVESLDEDSGAYTTLLTPTGKIIADFYCYRLAASALLDVRRDLSEKLLTKLQTYIIMDDVELSDINSEYSHISFQGLEASQLLRSKLGGVPELSPLGIAHCVWEDHPVVAIRKDELSTPGFELLLPFEASSGLLAEIASPDIGLEVRELGEQAYDVLRLERGIPIYGIDMSEKNNPLEAGLRGSYSLTKGCFVGQEVVAKATNIGGVARLLSQIQCLDQTVPDSDGKIFSEDGQEIGWITSAGYSPGLGFPIALGYLKRAVSVPDTNCFIESGSGTIPARIVEAFE
ncbi:MAG TPA: glycine cleavage T C-terminal barrel domain-containing protein [Acidobacteriota bacterium]|nr:glycine cleavage T C-terminal barrel domain-containing protein [Acidobacteriota bacterium]